MGATREVVCCLLFLACFLEITFGERSLSATEVVAAGDHRLEREIYQGLIDASSDGDLNAVKSLLQRDADVNGRSRGTTALIEASYHGHEDVVSFLILAGADLSAQDEAGFSALHAGTQKADVVIVRKLLESGADTEQRTRRGSTPLFLSAQYGHEIITEILLGFGAKRNIHNYQGVPALYMAAQKGFYSVVKLLLDANAHVDELYLELQSTPLMVASENGHSEICKELIRNGADVNAQSIYGVSPLHLAVAEPKSVSIVKELVGAGANINIKDDNQETPLHWAARFGNLEIVNSLLELGSSPLAKGKLGQIPADVLCRCEMRPGSEDNFQCPKMPCSKQNKAKIKKTLNKGFQPLPNYKNIQGSKRQNKSSKRAKEPLSDTSVLVPESEENVSPMGGAETVMMTFPGEGENVDLSSLLD